jgi:hypothetical protein
MKLSWEQDFHPCWTAMSPLSCPVNEALVGARTHPAPWCQERTSGEPSPPPLPGHSEAVPTPTHGDGDVSKEADYTQFI